MPEDDDPDFSQWRENLEVSSDRLYEIEKWLSGILPEYSQRKKSQKQRQIITEHDLGDLNSHSLYTTNQLAKMKFYPVPYASNGKGDVFGICDSSKMIIFPRGTYNGLRKSDPECDDHEIPGKKLLEIMLQYRLSVA